MTFSEIQEEINAYVKRKNEELLLQRRLTANTIVTMSNLISLAFNQPQKLPKRADDLFPELFKNTNRSVDWKSIKANMSSIAKAHNESMRRRDMPDYRRA